MGVIEVGGNTISDGRVVKAREVGIIDSYPVTERVQRSRDPRSRTHAHLAVCFSLPRSLSLALY